MKLLITGGHITPAIAVIEEIQKRKNIQVIVVGRKYNGSKAHGLSFEYKSLESKGIAFIHLDAGRLTRLLTIRSVINGIKFLPGLVHGFIILQKEKPDAVLSFGGYIALSVALPAWLLRIPVFTHEQTMKPGLTTKILAKFAKKVFISFPETENYFPNATLTGNPLRQTIYNHSQKNPHTRPLIYITGGSLGAHSLNKHIEAILPELKKTFDIIHQTGENEYQDFERLSKYSDSHYSVKKHVLDDEIGSFYHWACIIISRSGANTVCELIALQKPSVLIPLPWSAHGEQLAQAELLKNSVVSELFHQSSQSEELLTLIQKVYFHIEDYKKNFVKLEKYLFPKAAQNIVDYIVHEIE